MKAIRLTVKNIGLVADAVIELNQPLILFYGEIRQGKTTLLNSVKWVFGGTFPSDIIRRGETEASIRLDLDCGSVFRSFYIARDGSTKARPIVFEQAGVPVRDAVAEIKKLLNPFLLDQDYLRNMTELERKKYFASMFAVDTQGIDAQITSTETQAVATRAKLKAYGEIDLTQVLPPADIEGLGRQRQQVIQLHQEQQQKLHGELAKCRSDYQASVDQTARMNETIRLRNFDIDRTEMGQANHRARVQELKRQLEAESALLEADTKWLAEHGTRQPEVPLPPPPDTSALEKQLCAPADTVALDALLSDAQAQKVRYEQYQKNQQRQSEREADEAAILSLDATVRELRNKKLAKLKQCGESSGIPGLEFDEAGNFSFEGCQAGMLSTSQLMRLSSMLSALYPDGFGVNLIDRAESLGRSVFEFVEQAKRDNKTILAAIVGEKPAQVPAEIGVFVVENGVVK